MNKETKNISAEHPWDIEQDYLFNIRMFLPSLVVLLVVIFFSSLSAQRAIPFPEPITPKYEKMAELAYSQKMLAEDYQEVLDQLENLVTDYIDYFAEEELLQGRKAQNKLLKVLLHLEQGNYTADIDKLSGDVSTLIDFLREEEKRFKQDNTNREVFKLVRTLRRELEVLEDIIDEDLTERFHDHTKSSADIKRYLLNKRFSEKNFEEQYVKLFKKTEELLLKSEEFTDNYENIDVQIDMEDLKELQEAIRLQEELLKTYQIYIDESLTDVLPQVFFQKGDSGKIVIHIPPDAPDVPDIDDIHGSKDDHVIIEPVPPSPPVDYRIEYDGKAAKTKDFKDSLFITSSRTPIFINNKTGALRIKGWDEDKLLVTYKVNVIANSRKSASEFIDEISLRINSSNSGVSVSTHFPNLGDVNRQVVDSKMEVMVPRNNKITCENSFGRTQISNLNNKLLVKVKNSETIIRSVSGDVEIVSGNGKTMLTEVHGKIHLKSKKGPVYLDNCTATIDIANSYAAVDLVECSGKTSILNSGEITITNHSGDLSIDNSNGTISIDELSGNLDLSNSYKPLYVHSVQGSVTVENKNSEIDINDVSGISTAINKGGLIKARDLQGPVKFINKGGEIRFTFDGTLAGNSSIFSDYGLVNLFLSDRSNINVSAATEGGTISNKFPSTIDKDSYSTKTSFSLGSSAHKLDINGTNTTIVISEVK